MDFIIGPYIGINNIKFGMKRAEVRKALNLMPREFFKISDSDVPTDAYDEIGIHVYYDKSDICEVI